jgi:hypothetical protein
MEQALRHVLSEQEKLLKRSDADALTDILLALNRLAVKTNNQLMEGFNRLRTAAHQTREAKEIERMVDDLSETLWTPIQVAVSSTYERIENSLTRQSGKPGLVADTRAHYHNLRLRLLEQLLGARMLVLNSDLGDESERIWQQFLERHLGQMFRVLRGGHICDHQGNTSCQMDLIVVQADAQIFVPGDSNDGKAQVLIDQVISAIMVTSNLTAAKLKSDWQKLQSIPAFPEMEKDHALLKGHPWPLCYILAAQSDPPEELAEAWKEVCRDGHTQAVPQYVIALDTGYLYCGLRRWPCPTFPGNFIDAEQIKVETGIYAGLGLAWLLTQLQGRLAATQRQNLGAISRFANLLDDAMLRDAHAVVLSDRFETMFQSRAIAGVIEWGSVAYWVHNRLEVRSLRRKRDGMNNVWQVELLLPGVNPDALNHRSYMKHLRWFRYGMMATAGRLIAVEEWLNHKSKTEHKHRIAVFDTLTGEEVIGPSINALTAVSDVETISAAIEAELPSSSQ